MSTVQQDIALQAFDQGQKKLFSCQSEFLRFLCG
jgi:hypothetical protein